MKARKNQLKVSQPIRKARFILESSLFSSLKKAFLSAIIV
ncbi:hypothetical protein SMSK564_1774 [Streptococcus mitis SK564]|uniref:Uncharacterized protein n=1 Tax=Streptococcus mitis SK564 TaxID=585203 RepID=E1LPJ5_STRMT|nr:hypothetical protein SMSK564_1774 [Streptococcus mitis SK564]